MPVETTLDRYREKWREAPKGSDADGRIFSSELLALPDDLLLARWDEMAARRYGGELGWLGPLYGDTFRDRAVLELGSGLGFDGLRFAALGARWTFADIVPDNLAVIRRIAGLKGLLEQTAYHLISDDLSFDGLPDYDAIWVFGSIHHVPFEMARREARSVLLHLKPGGRWMELVYPRERWLREGALPFDQWGKLTDGERTPWAEWHDAEKIRCRLAPIPFRTILDFEFCSQNYRWVDLEMTRDRPPAAADFETPAPRQIDLLAHGEMQLEQGRRRLFDRTKWAFACPSGFFTPAGRIDLAASLASVGRPSDIAIDVELNVATGVVGIGLVDDHGRYLPAAQAIVQAAPDSHRMTLRSAGHGLPGALTFANMDARRRSAFALLSAVLRAD